MAVQFAVGRERFAWYSIFCGIIFPLCLIGAKKKHTPAPLIPILPLGFIWAY